MKPGTDDPSQGEQALDSTAPGVDFNLLERCQVTQYVQWGSNILNPVDFPTQGDGCRSRNSGFFRRLWELTRTQAGFGACPAPDFGRRVDHSGEARDERHAGPPRPHRTSDRTAKGSTDHSQHGDYYE